MPIPRTGRERSAIVDAGNVLKMILDNGVSLVLNGHRHITNLYEVTDGNNNLLVYNAGTFSSNKTRYNQLWTYTIMDISDTGITFQEKCIKGKNKPVTLRQSFHPAKTPGNNPTRDHESPEIARFIHLANSGISTSYSHDEAMLIKAIEKINSMECDLVIHSGRLVDSSYKEDFILARDYLNDITQPMLVIPGMPETHYPKSLEYFQDYIGPLEPYFENKNALFLGINSCKLQTKRGVIGRKTLYELMKQVEGKAGNKVLGVTLHHDIVPTPHERWESTLADAGDALHLFASTGFNLILSGRSYANWSVQVNDAIFSSCGSVSNKKALLHSDGNSFNIISIHEGGFTWIKEYQLQDDKTVLKRTFQIPFFQDVAVSTAIPVSR